MNELDLNEILKYLKDHKSIKWIILAVVIGLILFMLNPVKTIKAGHRGVVLNFGAVQDEIMN